MQPFDISLKNQGTSQANGAVTQSGSVTSSYTQPPALFYLHQPSQDNSAKMAQRDQHVKAYKDKVSSFGKYFAILFSFLSVIIGGKIAYIIINSDSWSAVQEIEAYASEIQNGGDLQEEFTDVRSSVSDVIESCITFTTCVQICGYLAIGFAIYHEFIFFLSFCMKKQEGYVIFLLTFEMVIFIGSVILASEIHGNECNDLVSDIFEIGASILDQLGTTVPKLQSLQFPDSTIFYFVVFAGVSLLNALTFCWWNVNIRQAKRFEQELALKLAMIS